MQVPMNGRLGFRHVWQALIVSPLIALLLISTSARAGAKEHLQLVHEFQTALEGSGDSALTLASDGRFYGVSSFGGALNAGGVFAMDLLGHVEVLHAFDANVDGVSPAAKLLAASDGYLYGSLNYGAEGTQSRCGSLFRVAPATGAYELLRSFSRYLSKGEGCNPSGALVEGHGGWIYGTTKTGGSTDSGTVYKWNFHSGAFKTIRTFGAWGSGDGLSPSGLAISPSGSLYGLTWSGGKFNVGTIYALNPDGTDYRLLFSFTYENNTLGGQPYGQMVLAKDGNFYGTTYSGAECCGTIFRLGMDGAVSLVYTLHFSGGIGWHVSGDLTLGPGGLLYGTTGGAGPNHGGTVFTVSTTGEVQVLQAFSYQGVPSAPIAGLTHVGSYMYGTARHGAGDSAVVYRVLKKWRGG